MALALVGYCMGAGGGLDGVCALEGRRLAPVRLKLLPIEVLVSPWRNRVEGICVSGWQARKCI